MKFLLLLRLEILHVAPAARSLPGFFFDCSVFANCSHLQTDISSFLGVDLTYTAQVRYCITAAGYNCCVCTYTPPWRTNYSKSWAVTRDWRAPLYNNHASNDSVHTQVLKYTYGVCFTREPFPAPPCTKKKSVSLRILPKVVVPLFPA